MSELPKLNRNQIHTAIDNFVNDMSVDIKLPAQKGVLCFDDIKIKDKSDIQKTNFYNVVSTNSSEWNDYCIPWADDPGVYILFDENHEAIYVGKSENKMGARISDHVKNYENHHKDSMPKYAILIPFHKEKSCLAPTFESYLLVNHHFPDNQVGQ